MPDSRLGQNGDSPTELIAAFQPRYFVIWTSRHPDRNGARLRKVVAAFRDPGPVARYLEALRPQDRPDYHAVDLAGHEIEMIAHRDDYYSHASALLPGESEKMWHPKDEMERQGWKFTDVTGKEAPDA